MAGHRFNPEKADKLLDPERKQKINLERIVEIMGLENKDHIVDFGAGNGFFTVPFAKEVERVLAVDIEPKMLELLKEHVRSEGLKNIDYIESDLQDIKLDHNVADKGIVAFVMHEIPKMEVALEEFKRIIKPGGKLLIVDWEAIESETGPPLHERIASHDMQKFLQEHGYKAQTVNINENVYVSIVEFE